MGKFTFRKEEKLKKELWIKELFAKGSSFHLYPFRVLQLPHPLPGAEQNQVMFSVSTRNFKRAVDRNSLKRRMREAYRLNKHLLEGSRKWLIAYIYTSKEIEPSVLIHEKMVQTLNRIAR